MNIAILPYALRAKGGLAKIPLAALRWPLGIGETAGQVGDLTADDHILIYPRSKHFLDPRAGVRCQVSLLIAEPFAVQRRNYLAAIALRRRYFRIITHRPAMARWTGNALVMPFGGSWVDTWQPQTRVKSAHMSLIASSKNELEGHALRHRTAAWCRQTGQDVDLLGKAYRPLDRKEDGLVPYRYSVVIENSREEGYFTEKLVDCLLCGALPIYWGAPDIARYFDPNGLIECHSHDDIRRAICGASTEQYEARRAALVQNRARALAYVDYEKNAALRLAESVGTSFRRRRGAVSTTARSFADRPSA
jgi:hypothetical protein